MTNRIKQFWNSDEPAPVVSPQQLLQITLTPMQMALVMNCISVGATVAGRVTLDPVEGAARLAKTATALRTFAKSVWLDVHAKLKPFEAELRASDDLYSEEQGPEDTEPESWQ